MMFHGYNTVPENLDLGDEYKVNSHLRDAFNREAPAGGLPVYYIVVASTKDLNTLDNVGGAIYNGIPTGVKYFYYGIDPDPLEGFSPVQEFIDAINRLASSSIVRWKSFRCYSKCFYSTLLAIKKWNKY